MMSYPILKSKRFWLVALAALLWVGHWAYHNKTVSFSIAKITSDFSYHSEWDVVGLDDAKLKTICNQKFHYLSAGSQSYAFVSDDGKYVIKFFRMKHLIPRISDYFYPEKVEHRKENLFSIFAAHKLAFDELREESGLIYLHLNRTHHLQTRLAIADWWGRSYFVDLDNTEFVVQEKAELIFTRLKKLLKQNDRSSVERHVAATMDLVQRQIDKGISDHDKAVTHNYGFVGDRPIHLDIGRIYKEKKEKDYDRIKARIEKWLEKNSS